MNQQPFKKRVEIVFGENDKDLWEWLENTSNRKATFIKKILRDLMNNTLLSNDEIEQKIKKEVQKAISSVAPIVNNHTNDATHEKENKNQSKGVASSFFGGREF